MSATEKDAGKIIMRRFLIIIGLTALSVGCSNSSKLPKAERDAPGKGKSVLVWEMDQNAIDSLGRILLQSATSEQAIDLFKKVLAAKGASDLPFDSAGRTALYYAIENNDSDFVKLLIAKGADCDVLIDTTKSTRHKDPLSYADAEYSRSLSSTTALLFASYRENLAICQMLITCGAAINQPDAEGNTPLMVSVSCNNQQLFALLIASGAKPGPTADDEVPLTAVMKLRNAQLSDKEMDYLRNIDLQKYGRRFLFENFNSSLERTHCYFSITAFEWLLNNVHFTVDDLGRALILHSFAEEAPGQVIRFSTGEGNLEKASLLLKKGADINFIDENGETPLLHAINDGSPTMAEYLLSNGANPDIKTKDGKSCIDLLNAAIAHCQEWLKRETKEHDGDSMLEASMRIEILRNLKSIIKKKIAVRHKRR